MVVLGVDIGGSKIAAATVLANATLRNKQVIPTPQTLEEFTEALIELCKGFLKKKHDCIALALPGFTSENGRSLFAGFALHFLVDTNLKRLLEKEFSLPVYVFNDADCFAVAEHVARNAPHELMLGVIWGSGVGFGLVQGPKNKLVFPVGSRIELGHQPYTQQTVEQLAGGVPVERRYFHSVGKKKTIKQLFAARSKDPVAKKYVDTMLDAMSSSLATAVLAFAPDRIVLGGGISQLPVLQTLQDAVRKKLPDDIVCPPIQRFSLGPDAGIIGAMHLARMN